MASGRSQADPSAGRPRASASSGCPGDSDRVWGQAQAGCVVRTARPAGAASQSALRPGGRGALWEGPLQAWRCSNSWPAPLGRWRGGRVHRRTASHRAGDRLPCAPCGARGDPPSPDAIGARRSAWMAHGCRVNRCGRTDAAMRPAWPPCSMRSKRTARRRFPGQPGAAGGRAGSTGPPRAGPERVPVGWQRPPSGRHGQGPRTARIRIGRCPRAARRGVVECGGPSGAGRLRADR